MRPPVLRIQLGDGLIVDSFAGGGGASSGIERALGRSPDIAINHDAEALAMHEANHPKTRHRTRRQLSHGLSRTPEYRAWQLARLRCTDPKHAAYPRYGGRGITFAAEWMDAPAAFIAHIGPRPTPNHEVDRIDNDRGYEPGNVRWATRQENDRNRRSNRMLTFRGETLALAEWCERLGLPTSTVCKRLGAGWTDEEALSAPVRAKAPNGAGRRDGRTA